MSSGKHLNCTQRKPKKESGSQQKNKKGKIWCTLLVEEWDKKKNWKHSTPWLEIMVAIRTLCISELKKGNKGIEAIDQESGGLFPKWRLMGSNN